MFVLPLQSGSQGNCIYLEAGEVRLLIDAGISGKQAEQRLGEHGREIRAVDAVLISHDHGDHTRAMGIFQRKFGLTTYVTSKTRRAVEAKGSLGTMPHIEEFSARASLRFGTVTVETHRTPHDAADGVVFVIDDGRHRLGVMTDLGHAFPELPGLLATLDAVVLESNHDVAMLRGGNYPAQLKRRIQGKGGHLSNVEAAQVLAASDASRLRWIYLAHLSEENNRPELAVQAHRDRLGPDLPIYVAHRRLASPPARL